MAAWRPACGRPSALRPVSIASVTRRRGGRLRRMRRSQSHAATAAGMYGTAHSGASRATLPAAAAAVTARHWIMDRPILSTMTVGCMSR